MNREKLIEILDLLRIPSDFYSLYEGKKPEAVNLINTKDG